MLGVLLMLFGCRKEKRDPEWDMDVLTPLAKTSLDIRNLLADSLIRTGPDGGLSLVYQYPLSDTLLTDLLRLPDTTLWQNFALSEMKLADASFTKSISLGQICEKGGITGATIIANQGGTLAIPSMNSTAPNAQAIDASDLFKQALITEGYMDLTIKNNFPIDLTNFRFSLSNQSDNSLILLDSVALLPANGGLITRTISLAGKKVESGLVGTLLNISSPGSGTNSVLIDTAQTCELQVTVRDIKVSSITSVFPSRTLIDFVYPIKILNDEIRIQEVDMEKAYIDIEAQSSIPENLKFNISSNYITKDGLPFSKKLYINKGTTGNYTITPLLLDFSGYKADLRDANPGGYNKLSLRVTASVDSTGIPSTITAQDSLKLKFTMRQFRPEKVRGYFGRSRYSLKGDLNNISLFQKVVFGSFALEQMKVGIYVENGVGVHGNAGISKLSAFRGNGQTDLQGPATNATFPLKRATDFPLTPSYNYFELNEQNSNILDLLQMMPDKLSYQFDLEVNPGGNISGYRDFYYNTSRIKAGLNVEIPLNISFDLLTLVDTVDFSPANLDPKERLNDGLLKVIVDNGYPFDAFVSVKLLDASGQLVDAYFVKNNWIKSGQLTNGNPANCSPIKSVLSENMDAARVAKLKSVKKAIVSITMNTSRNQKKKVFAGWKTDIKLVADFNVRVGGKRVE